MRFLKRFLRFWKRILRPPEVLSAVIGPEEPTVKFLFDDSHFNVPWKTVNQAAFKPSNKTRNISIYRTQGLEDGETFEIGHQYVTELRADKKPILAAACLQANIYLEEKLSFDPDGKPHPRHSNVNGWPWDKDVQRELRITLARKSCLLLPT